MKKKKKPQKDPKRQGQAGAGTKNGTSRRGTIVTIDGYDAEADLMVDIINLWDDYNKRSKVVTKVKHGVQVTMLMRVGKGVFIEAPDGERGWVTDHFIRELK